MLIRRIIQINKLVSLANALGIMANLTDRVMSEMIEEPIILDILPRYIGLENCLHIQLGELVRIRFIMALTDEVLRGPVQTQDISTSFHAMFGEDRWHWLEKTHNSKYPHRTFLGGHN